MLVRSAGQPCSGEATHMDKTMMVFGDAKKVVEDIVKAIE
jgi:NAD/NADP transhydrogenase beta subunit